MILYPAIDLLHGKVVQLVGGARDTEQVQLPDPFAVVDRWVNDGAEYVHVVDLNAAFGQGTNEEIVRRILRDRRIKVQVGGGLRSEEQVKSYLDAGAERVIVGTKALNDPTWLRTMAKRFPGRIVLAVDARHGQVVAHGWKKETGQALLDVARQVEKLPLAGLLYTAVHLEGRLQGIDKEGLNALIGAVRLPVIASGGITTIEDVKFLREAGAAGAVLGLALYAGRIGFQEALAIAEETPA